jgi:polyhydroxyalkanoate synthesis regulator phasin
MSNSLTRAFFIGRATAEALIDQLEDTLTDALSALGKFDAEQREKMRNFADTVLEKAAQHEGSVVTENGGSSSVDLQETIDNLRAEIAQLKSELQQHREENRV